MPYWLTGMLAATPALLWMFLGVGLPWALVALPRREWRDWPVTACLALAFGPALVTAWMFVLGSVPGAALLRLDTVLTGTAVIALVGWALVWRNRALGGLHTPTPPTPLRLDERLLLVLIGVALVIRWVGVAYWPFTAYDALWVYGYQGRLYTLAGHIPPTIDYYPQFLPLQFSFVQLAVGGIDDHAARAVLPVLHWGCILAVYVLGSRLFNRRVGLFAAAIWTLYPHVAEWSRFGDLEIPLTFLFTASAAFFAQAWLSAGQHARRYAIIAGLLLGIGMWTKPTMGGFIWGVALLVLVDLALRFYRRQSDAIQSEHRGDLAGHPYKGEPSVTIQKSSPLNGRMVGYTPRLRLALWTGLASIPLGAAWYLRNIALGHNAIDFPPGYWQTLAARSGVEFGWPLLALFVLCAWLLWRDRAGLKLPRLLPGLILVLAAVLPSIHNTGRVGITDNRMGALEWLALAAGAGLVAHTLWQYARERWTPEGRQIAERLGWLLLLALPYFITWFYSYSYHYRLSFAIVPLLLLPTAVILARWSESWLQRGVGRVLWSVAIIALAVPAIFNPLYDKNAGWNWLWTDMLPDDTARYTSGNRALMTIVDGLQQYLDAHDEPLRVIAPGMKRLPFFFPLEDIQIDTMPTRLDDLTGATYFIYSVPETGGDFNTFQPGQNQVLDALALANPEPDVGNAIMRRAWGDDDGVFKYTVYELHLEKRFEIPNLNAPAPADVVFADAVRFLGHDIGGSTFWPGRTVVMHLYWEVLKALSADYRVYIHLRDAGGAVLQAWDGPVTRTDDGNYYSMLVWQPGEIIVDWRRLKVDALSIPEGEGYQLVIGIYDPLTQARLPVMVDGQPAGDGFALGERIIWQAAPPS
ncbi:MAG: glycosyltransferase family 39 protein [Anaerolineae bacterium]|nr:glycosyltransferase family 39 protein [Anaerolineae bacterium]